MTVYYGFQWQYDMSSIEQDDSHTVIKMRILNKTT